MKRLALILLLVASPALADDSTALLDKAQQAIDDIDYETAKKLAMQAIDGGKLEGKSLHRAYRLAGESAAALGDNKSAKEHFLRWIVLDPKAELPAGSSPKIGLPFSEARAEADKLGRFAVDVAVNRQKDKVEIVLSAHDPLSMVAGMRLQLGDASVVAVTGNRAILPVADAASVSVAVAVVDARGNELSRRTVTGTSGGSGSGSGGSGSGGGGSGGGPDLTTPVGPTTRGGWPTIVRWPVWTGVAVVAAGAGGFFAYQVGQTEDELAALNAMSDMYSFDDAENVRTRGERQALFANIGFGVAGAAAVAAVLTFVLEPDKVEIQPAPTAGGATIGASIRF